MLFLKKILTSSNITLPQFLLAILTCIIIPNIILSPLAYYLGLNRPLINIDYLVPILLIALFKSRLVNLFLFVIFFIVFFIDITLLALQIFPFINLSDILYLSNFIFLGPITFRIYLVFFTLLLAIEFFIISKLASKTKPKLFIGIFICLLIIITVDNLVKKTPISSLSKFIASDTLFLILNHNHNFFTLENLTPLKATQYNHASTPWFSEIKKQDSLNNKLLLIVNESWGYPRDPHVRENILATLKSQPNIEFIKEGGFPVIGATVAGELRELCALDPQIIDLKNVHTGYENCLPNQLKQLGYKTISLHATSSLMYNRTTWYPLAGIDKSFFGDDLDLPKDSFDNSGIFDPNLVPFIANQFAQNNKLFFYWMTLTSHTPYPESDIRNKRFNCQQFDIDRDTESCRSIMLQAQFFDSLAKLISIPEMRGVEVVVVGDHPPPLLNLREGLKVFDSSKVSWIHFKVKNE